MPRLSFELSDDLAARLLSQTGNQQSRIDELVEFALMRYLGEDFTGQESAVKA